MTTKNTLLSVASQMSTLFILFYENVYQTNTLEIISSQSMFSQWVQTNVETMFGNKHNFITMQLKDIYNCFQSLSNVHITILTLFLNYFMDFIFITYLRMQTEIKEIDVNGYEYVSN